MKRPNMNLENHEEFFRFFAENDPTPTFTRAIHRIMGLIFHSQVEFQESAEYSVAQHFRNDGRFLLYAPHTKGTDPLILAEITQRQKVLRPFIANTIIPGHVGLNQHPLTRPVVMRYRRTLPVVRGKDLVKLNLRPEELRGLTEQEVTTATEAREKLKEEVRAASKQAVIDISTAAANNLWNVAIFPTGTRKDTKVRSGIGEIACGIDESVKDRFLMLPVGIDYNRTRTNLRPNVYIAEPQEIPQTPADVTTLVEQTLDYVASQAKAMD